jgi:hypothetical protein
MLEYKCGLSILPRFDGYVYCFCSDPSASYFIGCSATSKVEGLLYVEI